MCAGFPGVSLPCVRWRGRKPEGTPGPAEGEPIYPRRHDLLVVDELIARHFEHKLFLTATPHNGYTESSSALLELLDEQRFARGTLPDRRQLAAAMVRRLKSELTDFDGKPLFPARRLEPLEVPYPDDEREVHACLRRCAILRQQDLADGVERMATEFVLKTLKKRLFSSPAAFAATLEQHGKSLREATRSRGPAKPTLGILQWQLARIEEAADDEELEGATNAAVEVAVSLFREPAEEERHLLGSMRDWAERTRSGPDAKTKVLIEWLQRHIRPGDRWADERVILFTEYRATQIRLHGRLVYAGFAGEDRIMLMHGGMDQDQRESIKAVFQEAEHQEPDGLCWQGSKRASAARATTPLAEARHLHT